MRAPTDTDPVALRVLNELYANMSPAEKLSRVRDLTLTSVRLALAGLRRRHPDDSEQTLLLRLARSRLGPATVERVLEGTGEGDAS